MHTLQNQVKSKVRIKAQRQKLNCHFKKKYSIRTATITVTIKIKPKKYQEYAKALYKFSANLPGPSSGPSARHVLVRPRHIIYVIVILWVYRGIVCGVVGAKI